MKINRFLHVGIGGIKCGCCFPPRGKRKSKFRSAKRRARIDAVKIERLNCE